jgi:hexosaminidase
VQNFQFTSVDCTSSTLTQAYERYNTLIFQHNVTKKFSKDPYVNRVSVSVEVCSEDYPQLSTDESYTLDVPADVEVLQIEIKAKTVYGALRALESLSQLVTYDYDLGSYLISSTPISIADAPRYAHRGMLLDTARHYQPVSFIQKTIDALSYAKYNVLHWHVVDTQSFPFESQTYPKLWDGSYTKQERYSTSDILSLVEYGRLRGVKIMIEFDMPGHAGSWCAGYPEICPSPTCTQPLDPSSDATFPLITSLLGEVTGAGGTAGVFPYELLHLGGDEVSYTCWEASPKIKAWEKKQGFAGSEDTYEYFVDKTASIARSQNRLPVQWVEVFEHFGSSLSNDTVVHVWKEKSTLDGVLQAGYRSLLSNQDSWYLDHLDTTWQTMYLNEPTEGLSPSSDPSLILGGESCMWAETVDPSVLENTVWPRAAAVAEVLWTLQEVVYDKDGEADLDVVEDRLESFRCLLTQRGVAAAPVQNAQARYAPREPGSCYAQRRRL